jgi:hypothetical protein
MVLSRQLLYIYGRRSFLTLLDLKFNPIAFLQGLVALTQDRGVVNEHILITSRARNEPKPLLVVKPLHGPDFAFRHFVGLLLL